MSFEGSVTIRNAHNSAQSFVLAYNNKNDFEKVKDLCGDSKTNFLKAAVVPIRTNNGANFAKDFFLPQTVQTALNSSHVALKIFVMIFALAFDIITFPVRLFTALPRYLHNKNAPEAPLATYLKTTAAANALKQGNIGDVVKSEQVLITFESKEVTKRPMTKDEIDILRLLPSDPKININYYENERISTQTVLPPTGNEATVIRMNVRKNLVDMIQSHSNNVYRR